MTQNTTESNWTRDNDGNFVNWLEPKYNPRGRLTLTLEGEVLEELPDEIFTQRMREYSLLLKREKKRSMEKFKKNRKSSKEHITELRNQLKGN